MNGDATGSTVLYLPPGQRLELTLGDTINPLLGDWLPTTATSESLGTDLLARISVESHPELHTDAGLNANPLLRLGPIRASGSLPSPIVELQGNEPDILDARIDLEERLATCRVSDGNVESSAYLRDAMTVCVGLLLARSTHCLIHAAGVCTPGGVWLIPGDARSGKSSTLAALVEAGHDWVSDDQMIISPAVDGGAPSAHGWPKSLHIDTGLADGIPTGNRTDVAPDSLGPGQLLGSAQIAGVLVPEIADRDPGLEPMSAGDSLKALVRQSPWLVADRRGAETCLPLLEAVARKPAFRLILGRGSFGNGQLLSSLVLGALLSE